MVDPRLIGTDNVKIERASGNVFADLGVVNAESHLLKADLVSQIDIIIRKRGLRRIEAAKVLGLSQPNLSRLLAGSFQDFSMERLLRLLTKLGHDVKIVIREVRSGRPGKVTVVAQPQAGFPNSGPSTVNRSADSAAHGGRN